jgi:hypothetical protein
MFCDARHHGWADFIIVVEGEYIVRPTGALKDAMGAAGSLDAPADAEQRSQNPSCFG